MFYFNQIIISLPEGASVTGFLTLEQLGYDEANVVDWYVQIDDVIGEALLGFDYAYFVDPETGWLSVIALDDDLVEGPEEVIYNISGFVSYTIGTEILTDTYAGFVTLKIFDYDTFINICGGKDLPGTIWNDFLIGTSCDDILGGDLGDDILRGLEGNDTIYGGPGNDSLLGEDGNDILDGGTGDDTMDGGLGNDFYIVDSVDDVIQGEIVFSLGGGIDTVRVFIDNYVQPTNIELVRLGNITDTANFSATGNDAPGTLVGNAGRNVLNGRGGNDQINGNDGNDILIGGEGADTLVGGSGSDTFVFSSVSNSRPGSANRDLINGFDRGQDVIDLSAIDANTTTFGVDDAFTFIGTSSFTGIAGQLRVQGLGGPNASIVEMDVNGDRVADMQIFINLQTSMVAGDFIL